MSFLGLGKKSRAVPPNAAFRLTQEGREKLQQFNGDPKSQILVALETSGTSDIEEISRASGLSRGQVEKLVPKLAHQGYIQYVSASSIDEV